MKKPTFIAKIKSKWRSFTKQEKIVLSAVTIYLCWMLFRAWLPVLFALLNSVKTLDQYYDNPLSIPVGIQWENFARAMKMTHNNNTMPMMFYNTIIYVVTFTLGNNLCSLMVAYVLAKYRFFGNKFLYGMIIATSIIPIFGTEGAAYLLMSKLGMVDNIYLLWISGASGFDYTALILHSYFVTTANTYKEAAELDGASSFRIFWEIMVPLVSGQVLYFTLSNVIGLWNGYTTPLLYLPNHPTVSTGLYGLRSLIGRVPGGEVTYFAGVVICSIPMIVFFSIFEKYITSIRVDGGIKG